MTKAWTSLLVLPFILVSATHQPAQSQEAGDPYGTYSCTGGYRCGSQEVDESSDNRRAPGAVSQPRADSAPMGSCGSPLPIAEAYNAQLDGVRCGSGGENRPRKPMPISEEVLEKWSARASNSRGMAALEDMQKIRYVEEKIDGTIEYPMTEYWSYEGLEGGFNSSQCGTELVPMMCSRAREESYTHRWTSDDGECLLYERIEEETPRSYTNPGSFVPVPIPMPRRERRDDSGYSRPQIDRRQTPPAYRGEGANEIRDRSLNNYRNSIGRGSSGSSRPSGSSGSRGSGGSTRSGSSGRRSSNETRPKTRLVREINGRCLRRASVEHSETRWRSAGRMSYPCVLPRPKYCTWSVRRSASRCLPTAIGAIRSFVRARSKVDTELPRPEWKRSS